GLVPELDRNRWLNPQPVQSGPPISNQGWRIQNAWRRKWQGISLVKLAAADASWQAQAAARPAPAQQLPQDNEAICPVAERLQPCVCRFPSVSPLRWPGSD